jgi:phenylalanyl-tRNA synthetase beta chain
MGGVESEVYDASKEVLDAKGMEVKAGEMLQGKVSIRGKSTTNVLLEGAAWNFINIRRTTKQHNIPSEASFRFSRGVHPELAEMGVRRGLQYMAAWSGGTIAPGLVDEYPLKLKEPKIELTPHDVTRLLGIDLTAEEICTLLERLEFKCKIRESGVGSRRPPKKTKSRIESPEARISVTAPAHRLDIGEDVIGLADVLEEVARVYGYDHIPSTSMADALPPQIGNPVHEWDERLRDLLVALGFDEVVSYRLTQPDREARLGVTGEYVRIANPIAPEKSILRRSLLASVLDALERNARQSESLAFFEVGPVFEPAANAASKLPEESWKLALAMTGLRQVTAWDAPTAPALDFYDVKGRIELLLSSLRYPDFSFAPIDSVAYLHPGKAAEVRVNGQRVGAFGELHPLVKGKYELGPASVLVAEFDLELLRAVVPVYEVKPVPEFPPILEDIALIVDESIPASRVEALIRQTGGKSVTNVRLFDFYRGEQIGAGKKSLAYNLTYQAPDKTMTDSEAAAIRAKIVRRLEQEVGARLRG